MEAIETIESAATTESCGANPEDERDEDHQLIHRHNQDDDGEDEWWRMLACWAGAGCSLACRGPDLGNRK